MTSLASIDADYCFPSGEFPDDPNNRIFPGQGFTAGSLTVCF
ncbi:hypothetical protein ACMHYB_22830 [Sorangium sp. So ce1128]